MVLGAFQNQDYPLELLLNKIKKREAGRNPLAEVTFAYHNIGLPTHGIDELSISPYLKNTETSKFELSLFGSEMNGQISLQIDFRKNLFRRETIERMGLYFKEIMKDLLDNQHKKLKDVKIDYDFAVKKLNIFERQKSDFVF
jgi:non-ribosomal peptide synthetase component F